MPKLSAEHTAAGLRKGQPIDPCFFMRFRAQGVGTSRHTNTPKHASLPMAANIHTCLRPPH